MKDSNQEFWALVTANEEKLSQLLPIPAFLITREDYEEIHARVRNLDYKALSSEQFIGQVGNIKSLLDKKSSKVGRRRPEIKSCREYCCSTIYLFIWLVCILAVGTLCYFFITDWVNKI